MTSPDLMPAVLKMISALVLVAGIAFVALSLFRRFVKGTLRPGRDDEAIRIVSSKYIGSKHSIVLLDVMGDVLVVGLSATEMTMLAHLDGKDYRDRLSHVAEKERREVSFAEHLAGLTSRFCALGGTSCERQGNHNE